MKNLKKWILLVGVAVFNMGTYAQKASVETASIGIRTYNKDNNSKEKRIHALKEAKKHIDMAAENSTTATDPKMYLMRGRIYLAIHLDKLGEDQKSVIPDDEAIAKAADAIIKLYESNDKGKYSKTRDAYDAFVGIAVSAQNIAITADQQKDYERAIKYYQIGRDLIPHDEEQLIKRQNITSDGLLNSIAYAEYKAKKYDDAKKHYHELIDKSYNDPLVYMDLYTIYLQIDKDTARAIETIDRGRSMFEENKTLKDEQIYIYGQAGRSDELFKIISGNIELDPYNDVNYLMRGKLHRSTSEKMKQDAESAKPEKKEKLLAESNKHAEEAVKDYEKALEMNDMNMEAHYELGEMYYLSGADLMDQANALDYNETEKFEKLSAEAKEEFKKAIPSWEALYEMSTEEKDRGKAAQFLMQLYLKTEQMDKYKEIKAAN